MNKTWTPHQEYIIRTKFNELDDTQLTKYLNEQTGSTYNIYEVKKKRQRMGLKKVRGLKRRRPIAVEDNNKS